MQSFAQHLLWDSCVLLWRPMKKWVLVSLVWLFVTPRTVAHQVPLPMEFSRQEYWSGLPFPSLGDLPDPGIEPRSPALQEDPLQTEPPGKPYASLKTNISLIFIYAWSSVWYSIVHLCTSCWWKFQLYQFPTFAATNMLLYVSWYTCALFSKLYIWVTLLDFFYFVVGTNYSSFICTFCTPWQCN